MSEELRTEPRISMNKLAEYVVTTSPRRRRKLIVDQIKPQTYITTNYEAARRGIVRVFSNPAATARQLVAAAASLRDRHAHTPNDSLLACARAIEAFAPLAEKVRPKNVLAVAGARRDSNLILAGVRVVICPDISFLERQTERRIGALKFHFPVTNRLKTEALRYAAAMLYAHLEECGDVPRRAACIAVDVMAGEHECAPRAMRDRLRNLEAACEEIAERWPVLLEALQMQPTKDWR